MEAEEKNRLRAEWLDAFRAHEAAWRAERFSEAADHAARMATICARMGGGAPPSGPQYIGDGVYCETAWDKAVVAYTHDGIYGAARRDVIYFEPETLHGLVSFARLLGVIV